jgi:hypothetical protein
VLAITGNDSPESETFSNALVNPRLPKSSYDKQLSLQPLKPTTVPQLQS